MTTDQAAGAPAGAGQAGPRRTSPAPRPVPRGAGPFVVRRALAARTAVAQLSTALGTAVLAVVAVVAVVLGAVACLVGVGLVLLPLALRGVRSLADLERARLSWLGRDVVGPGILPRAMRAMLADAALRRELVWVAVHATLGLALSMLATQVAVYAVQYATAPAWWQVVPDEVASLQVLGWTVFTVDDWAGAWTLSLFGPAFALLLVVLAPGTAALQAAPAVRLLGPPPGTDLSLRVAELTATRAAALDAHATELRRIERALHDGSQNRLVAVTVLIGAARRTLARDPAMADELLERAQSAAELALAELREVVRSVLPPVLADRGLAGALTGLAADSAVPCHVEVDVAGRLAASVEATAYFVVAEALTNAARHSGAGRVDVRLRRRGDRLGVLVRDDGRGGAHEGGSGLAGIRRRVQALDGTMTLTSPPGGPTTVDVELMCGS